MKVEDFFRYLFSDDALNFLESFRQKCGDKGSQHETFKLMHFNCHFSYSSIVDYPPPCHLI